MKKLIELHNKLDPSPTDWKREANTRNKIVYLTMDLYIGSLSEKVVALLMLAESAHFAREKNLVTNTMDKLRQLAEDTKLEFVQRYHKILERRFSQWSTEFNSGNAPEEREIYSIRAIRFLDLILTLMM